MIKSINDNKITFQEIIDGNLLKRLNINIIELFGIVAEKYNEQFKTRALTIENLSDQVVNVYTGQDKEQLGLHFIQYSIHISYIEERIIEEIYNVIYPSYQALNQEDFINKASGKLPNNIPKEKIRELSIIDCNYFEDALRKIEASM